MNRRPTLERHRAETNVWPDKQGRVSFVDALKSRIGLTAAVAFIGVAALTAFGVEQSAIGLYYNTVPVIAPPFDQSPNPPGQAELILGHEPEEISVQSLLNSRFGDMNRVISDIANAGITRTCSIDVDIEHSAMSNRGDRSVARRIGAHIKNWIDASGATVSLVPVFSNLHAQDSITEVSISGVGAGQSCPQ